MKLLNLDNNAKTVKGQKRGYRTAVLYLAPADLSGFEVCPMRTQGCTRACLNTAGRGAFSSVQASRIAKTRFFFKDRHRFMGLLVNELDRFVKKAERDGFKVAVRLNGTSDILWERVPVRGHPNIMSLFPEVQFYDYTKHRPSKRAHLPSNYHLTYSLSEDPESEARSIEALELGWNVAVVFRKKIPEGRYGLYPIVDGDQDDLRFLERGVVVGLKAKGQAKKDTSGFVKEG